MPAQLQTLLITGMPASGKTSFGDWLRDNRGYVHVDLDAADCLKTAGLPPFWTEKERVAALDSGRLREFVRHLRTVGRSSVLTWTFPTDLVDFTRAEIAELIRLGCEYIQIDAPQYAALLDEKMREGYRQRGADPDKMLDACVELDNAIIAGHPSGVTFGIHICRGNHKSMFYASGGYDRIAAEVFGRSKFDRFLLEYDDQRSGTFEPLRHVPDGRVVVLGLVSSKVERMETPDDLKARIKEASQFVPLDRLALSPQCGFASTHEGNRLSADDQRRKLELVGRVARSTWSRAAKR